jgi:predicted metal-dependent hydrolase
MSKGGLVDFQIITSPYKAKFFKSRWSLKKDNDMILNQFNQIKKKENEMVSEFDTKFDKMHSQIPHDFHPTTTIDRLVYFNSYEG